MRGTNRAAEHRRQHIQRREEVQGGGGTRRRTFFVRPVARWAFGSLAAPRGGIVFYSWGQKTLERKKVPQTETSDVGVNEDEEERFGEIEKNFVRG